MFSALRLSHNRSASSAGVPQGISTCSGSPTKEGRGGAVAHVGVDEMALPGAGGLIGEEIPAAGGGIAVRALEDGEGVVAVLFYQPGDTGGVVGGVGLKGSGVEGLGKGLARGQPLADGVGLVAVGDDGGGAEHPHRGVDNKGGVGHFGGVKGLGADAVRGLHEDPVAGVLAASHDKIGNDGLLPVGGAAQHDAASGIGVAAQQRGKIQVFHDNLHSTISYCYCLAECNICEEFLK